MWPPSVMCLLPLACQRAGLPENLYLALPAQLAAGHAAKCCERCALQSPWICRFRLKDVERCSLAVWEKFGGGPRSRPAAGRSLQCRSADIPSKVSYVAAAYSPRVDGHTAQIAIALPFMKLCLVQALSYMASRGHPYGIISTYFTTWVLKADGKGTVWVSPAINYMTNGNCSGEVTVPEVCTLKKPVYVLLTRVSEACTCSFLSAICSCLAARGVHIPVFIPVVKNRASAQ